MPDAVRVTGALLDLTELEAELDHVLDCTRALREHLKQANLTVTAIVEREDTYCQLSLPSCAIGGSLAAQPSQK
jgi:hypothetical protein